MTARYDIDRQVSSWLASERRNAAPEGLLEATVREIGATRRRPGWRIPDRYSWRHSAQLWKAARALILVSVLAVLVLLAMAFVALVGSARPAPPFGLTRAGLIAFDTADGIVVDRADGTDRHVVVKPDGESVSPTWSRDGLHLAYWHRPGTFGSWSLVVVDPDGSEASVLAESVTLREREASLSQPSNISWSPDSRRVAFASDVGDNHGIFVATLGRTRPTLITDPSLGGIDPAWNPDGSVIAFQSEATETLHVVAPDGTGEHQLAALPHTFLWPDWSPDGASIATVAWVDGPKGPDDGQSDVFVVSANGAVVDNISRDPSEEYSPTWSPDGSRLAWARVPKDGSARAFIVVSSPDGPNVVEIRINADLAPPVWAPDGTRIYSYVQGSDGKFHEVVVIDPEGVVPVVRLPAEGNTGNGNWQRLP
jgi:Tol biopolymer transport system component